MLTLAGRAATGVVEEEGRGLATVGAAGDGAGAGGSLLREHPANAARRSAGSHARFMGVGIARGRMAADGAWSRVVESVV